MTSAHAETDRKTLRKKLIVLVEPRPIIELTRENARMQVIEDVKAAWKLSGTTEELNLIVLDADEKKRVAKNLFRRREAFTRRITVTRNLSDDEKRNAESSIHR